MVFSSFHICSNRFCLFHQIVIFQDKTDTISTSNAGSNEIECNNLNVNTPKGPMSICKSRQDSKKHTKITGEVETEVPQTNNSISMISQRPRRQVKHKFIKSANANITVKSENSVANNEVSDDSTSLLSTLSPNSKMRLVPMVYRLPMNASKLNWQDLICNNSTETIEIECGLTTILETEPGTSNAEEIRPEQHEKSNNSKETVQSAHQLRRKVCPIEAAECYKTIVEDDIEKEEKVKSTFTDKNPTSSKFFYLKNSIYAK